MRHRWRVTACVLLMLAPFVAPVTAEEQAAWPITIGVSPPRFEVEIGSSPRTEAVRVYNFGSEPAEIQGSVQTWDLDEANQVRLIEPNEQSLDQWVVINPLRFTIPPGGSQTVRFSIRPKVRPEPGEHRAILYFEQLPTQGSTIRVRGRLGVAVYGYVGDVRREAELHRVAVESSEEGSLARFDITSHGSAHVRMNGQYAIWPSALYPGAERTVQIEGLGEEQIELPEEVVEVGFLPGIPVLPASRRDLTLRFAQLAPGRYVLDVNGDLSGSPLDLAIPFTVEAPHASRAAAQ